jgi:uncharacterized membrane protein
MKHFLNHMRVFVLRGILASIPLGLSLLFIQFTYVFIDRRISDLLERYVGFRVPGLGILLCVFFLYCLGLLTSNVIGRQFFRLIEIITTRIPIVKTIYQVGKQLSFTLSLPEKQAFKRVVLVQFFHPGVWCVGFVTGTIVDSKSQEERLKIFVPHVPNPTSGFLFLVNEDQTIDPKWTVEEGMRTVISGGIIGPPTINQNLNP